MNEGLRPWEDSFLDKTAKSAWSHDPVDRFATEILRHPERADALKDRFRREIRGSSDQREPEFDADLEDLWDNVPV